ncbi:segregation/condensation protein A [Phaeovibrio sulfidiphilus]|uniref:Segregation and condensation protein A n=1 Tax=Phaeovibrio sulfidiphilus TaxID=1220600 RepID=A0A8J6YQQ0_9PROT|nr:ScpA family protein [Phaeovibrio sulfidiphilus]MBE1237597.1 segregation/condensation protein A [Phaeovibrio sulfidiphilus]
MPLSGKPSSAIAAVDPSGEPLSGARAVPVAADPAGEPPSPAGGVPAAAGPDRPDTAPRDTVSHAAPSSPPPAGAASPGGGDPLVSLVLNLEGFEGPIDVLLVLARDQKVDLARLSILQLAEQYLDFIATARSLQLDVAADYLVMAAWLAYLKSRLLIPAPPSDTDEPSGEAMASALQFQLRRLEAMQNAGRTLMARPRLGLDTLRHGQAQGFSVITRSRYETSLHDLLSAYGSMQRARERPTVMTVEAFELYSVDDALRRFETMLGALPDWATLDDFLPNRAMPPLVRRSAVAATFVAALELARQGLLEIRQDGGFGAPLQIRNPARPLSFEETRT